MKIIIESEPENVWNAEFKTHKGEHMYWEDLTYDEQTQVLAALQDFSNLFSKFRTPKP